MTQLTVEQPNRPAPFWREFESSEWITHQAIFDAMLRPFGDAVLAAANAQPGEAVIDVGCGCGDTTLALARAVGPTGATLGVDIAQPMIERARALAVAAGLQADFVVADAERHPFAPDRYDLVFSRFGVMFFADPIAAFRNLGQALRADGRFTFVCWQAMTQNLWFTVPGAAAFKHLPRPAARSSGGPGPFSLGDPALLQELLAAAGFRAINISAVERPLVIPGEVADAVNFYRDTSEGRQYLAAVDAATMIAALDEIGFALRPYLTPAGVALPGAAWLVTARWPRVA